MGSAHLGIGDGGATGGGEERGGGEGLEVGRSHVESGKGSAQREPASRSVEVETKIQNISHNHVKPSTSTNYEQQRQQQLHGRINSLLYQQKIAKILLLREERRNRNRRGRVLIPSTPSLPRTTRSSFKSRRKKLLRTLLPSPRPPLSGPIHGS